MKIIELFGLPGSGKTMCTAEMYTELKKRGYRCILLRANEYVDLPALDRKRYILRIFKFNNLILLSKLLCLSLLYKGGEYYLGNLKTRVKILLRQIMYLEIYKDKKIENDYDILISDQGIVQELTGFLLEKKNIYSWINIFLDMINRDNVDISFIYLDYPVEKVGRNIKKRNRRTAEMDFYTESTLDNYLKDYDYVLKEFYKKNNENKRIMKLQEFKEVCMK
ncbi:hypothetical protein MZD87_07715 [Pediococcus pentosaceus]|uniref:hypothetical protein n=1 Tax=Pediococcus pentosaceus TaxID=1255 RepID=UPI002119FEC5|nr:hypothetical protein [Pediococcus pentosaceus]MCQ9196970.1 hypothetical protein [Pediococcus pentosaceus]